MFGSEILDVAIGLVCFFLLLSLVCTSIKEAIETVMKYRARDLERGIREMLASSNAPNLVADLYAHPLINALFLGRYNPKNTKNLPSYIPPATFAFALLDIIHPAGTVSMPAPSEESIATPHLAAAQRMGTLRAAIITHPNATIQGALLPLLDAAGSDAEQMRKNVESWYDSVMDRVSGLYKRRTQIIIAAIALSLASLFNADAIGIARYIGTNQTARAVIVAHAQQEIREQGAASNPDLVHSMVWLEDQGGIPIGWRFKPAPNQDETDYKQDWRQAPATVGAWAIKLAGLLCTTFAISLGAPFWFDVLNKFMVIRSTVKPREKSRDEPSKS